MLANQIMSQLHRRAGAAPSNFADVLPAGDSELMQQLTKDPYNLEFLTLTAPVAERDLERALVAQVERFLLELGTGFAFVGRQWRLELDGDEFFIDLLMFHIPTSRYLVLELKTDEAHPGRRRPAQLLRRRRRRRGPPRTPRPDRRAAAVRHPQRTHRPLRTGPLDVADGRRRLPLQRAARPPNKLRCPPKPSIVDAVSAALDRFDPESGEA